MDGTRVSQIKHLALCLMYHYQLPFGQRENVYVLTKTCLLSFTTVYQYYSANQG